MAEKDEKLVSVEKPEVKEGPFDITQGVTVVATDKAPHHKKGQEIYASEYIAELMVSKGWATKGKSKE